MVAASNGDDTTARGINGASSSAELKRESLSFSDDSDDLVDGCFDRL